MRRLRCCSACVVLSVVLAVAALPAAQGSTEARAGGIFRVSFQGSSSLQAFDHIDPALAYSRESWTLLDTVCARLMRYRDRPPPQGYQLVPDVAAAPPTVSAAAGRGRSGCGAASASATANPSAPTRSPRRSTARWRQGSTRPDGSTRRAIVGAEDVRAGKATRAAGVTARGNTLVVRFTRPVVRVRRLDDDAVLLRSPADADARPVKACDAFPGRRSVLREGVPS